MLTIYIVLWSLFTVLTGLASGFAGLLAARLLCGMAEAGAYPTAMALIRKWIPLTGRARASSMFALGGGGGQGGGLDPHVGCGVASEAHAPSQRVYQKSCDGCHAKAQRRQDFRIFLCAFA